MEFLPPQLPPPSPSLSINDPSFSLIYDSTNNRNNFLAYFQTCLKELNLYNYNVNIHQNVINIIQKLKDERYVYLSENNRLKEANNQLEHQNNGFKTLISQEKAKSKDLCDQNQKLISNYYNVQNRLIISDKKFQELQNTLNSTNTQNQQLLQQNKVLQDQNIDLNFKITEFKGKIKSVKECEEIIGTKNEEIERLKENIHNLINQKATVMEEGQKMVNELKQKVTEYEIQESHDKENIQSLMQEKATIIIEFSKKVEEEQAKIRDLNEKLKEFEIRKNCIISEADGRNSSGEGNDNERPRKKPKYSFCNLHVPVKSLTSKSPETVQELPASEQDISRPESTKPASTSVTSPSRSSENTSSKRKASYSDEIIVLD